MGHSGSHRVSLEFWSDCCRTQKELHLQDHSDAESRRSHLWKLSLISARVRSQQKMDWSKQASRPNDLLHKTNDESVPGRTRNQVVLRLARPLEKEECIYVRMRVPERVKVRQLHAQNFSFHFPEHQQNLQIQAMQFQAGEE